MHRFGDDLVAKILNLLPDPNDRSSFSQVCKQWLRIEGYYRSSLHVFEPELLFNFLPRFPNLVKFESSKLISNAHIDFLAKTCSNLEILILNFKEKCRAFDESYDGFLGEFDFDDYGLFSVAKSCINLEKVCLKRRLYVGDVGVVCLVKFSRNLKILDLGGCGSITDAALEAIGGANCLEVLNLQGCCLVTDTGLEFLSNGLLSKTLKKLVIAECDRVTDIGVLYLRQMSCLEDLNLAKCGPKVTDIGGEAIAEIKTIKRLNLGWLINVSDITLVALARECSNLVAIDLTGCELISGYGICAFVNHGALEMLVLAHCFNFSGNNVVEVVFGCRSLTYIALDKRMRMWIPESVRNYKHCLIDWK